MRLTIQTPKKAIKAYLKQKPLRSEMDAFKANLIGLLSKISLIENGPKDESEEHLKNNLRDFLRDTFYKNTNAINTKDKKDLVIHLGKTTDSAVGVIIEAKRPSNVYEMIKLDNPNKKALHELIFYYLNERIKENNNQLKHLVITNINEWYIIDANYFDKYIYRNTQIRQLFETKLNDRKDNPFFYEEIAKIVAKMDFEIPCVYFDINDYDTVLRNDKKEDDRELIALYKIFSPTFLLKITAANDSNSLNEKFYSELLHIIGLEEAKEDGKKIIRRKKVGRNAGSLIEATIEALVTEDPFHKLPDPSIHGETDENKLFHVSLELCIIWINRILFLKLLEGQLINYHQGNKDYRFLNIETINDFDELFKLFHKVLALNYKDRNEAIKEKYSRVPYLNSSLFEISEFEDQTIKINSLDNAGLLELTNTTVLKDVRKNTDKLPTLEYLFKFLDAYDFASEGTEEVQEDNKTIINASVLGKVFEKINGYKDGSIFTPAFITMYMCNHSIRLAVLDKFNNALSGKSDRMFDKFEDLKNYTKRLNKTPDILRANAVVNSLRICDPAVGSGHFLVSSLNEIINIKAELGILADKDGNTISGYEFDIINDELIITDIQGNTTDYRLNNGKPLFKEMQRLQKTLFFEKQTIIENCLFGVDINPNSVKICRLRLWIELLKNAFYKEETNFAELETLPNIDINIKCGNSLISRFTLDDDVFGSIPNFRKKLEEYKLWVNEYKNAKDRTVKKKLIDNIKLFTNEFKRQDPKIIKLQKDLEKLSIKFNEKYISQKLFSEDTDAKHLKEKGKLQAEIAKINEEIQTLKSNKIYNNAFEWRFEFPEVLNVVGEFEGFDLIIGNPPYYSISKSQMLKALQESYFTFESSGDILCLFYEKGNQLLKDNGLLFYITSNKWMRASYGRKLRKYLFNYTNPIFLFDFSWYQVFENASVDSNLLGFTKNVNMKIAQSAVADKDFEPSNFKSYIESKLIITSFPENDYWAVKDKTQVDLKNKLAKLGKPLSEWGINIFRGILTGHNDAFIIDENKKNELVKFDKKNNDIIKPLIRGRDVERYDYSFNNLYLINAHNGIKELELKPVDIPSDYPKVYEHLLKFKDKAVKRADQGDNWFNLRNCAYLKEFEKEKLIWAETMRIHKTGDRNFPRFGYDNNGIYTDKTVFFAIGTNLKYLLALLNSTIGKWLIMEYVTKLDTGGYMMQKIFLDNIPIFCPNVKQEKEFISIVDEILQFKSEGKDTLELENDINKLVFKLYEITPEEQKIIEKNQ